MSAAWVEVWRGPRVESRHRVSIAVVDAEGRLRAAAGDPDQVVYARSAIKPIQTLPLVEDGAADRFGFTPEELALASASHGGEPFHVEAARSILRKIGADEDALACGAHAPMHAPAARELDRAGTAATRVHNNCSGKHAAMLALARHHGWPVAGYERPDHPVQRRMAEELARWTGHAVEEMVTATDGCGVVTFALPLSGFARAFARLAAAARKGSGARETNGAARDTAAAARVVGAMLRHPEYVGGTDRLCTALMRGSGGRIFAKVGAEGVYCAGVPGAELGIALKVEDGAKRAAEPALVGVLGSLGLLGDEERAELARYAEPDLTNTRGEAVGRIRARIELELAPGHG